MRTLNIPGSLFATDQQLLPLKYFKLAISYVNEGDNYTVTEQMTTKAHTRCLSSFSFVE